MTQGLIFFIQGHGLDWSFLFEFAFFTLSNYLLSLRIFTIFKSADFELNLSHFLSCFFHFKSPTVSIQAVSLYSTIIRLFVRFFASHSVCPFLISHFYFSKFQATCLNFKESSCVVSHFRSFHFLNSIISYSKIIIFRSSLSCVYR